MLIINHPKAPQQLLTIIGLIFLIIFFSANYSEKKLALNPANFNLPATAREIVADRTATTATFEISKDNFAQVSGISQNQKIETKNFFDSKKVLAQTVSMPNSPAIVSTSSNNGGVKDWANPGNAKADDKLYAVATLEFSDLHTYYLYAHDFGFTIPDGAEVKGVVVETEGYLKGKGQTNSYANLIVSGALNDDYERAMVGFNNSDQYIQSGDIDDLWDTNGLKPSQINAADFGYAIFFYEDSFTNDIFINHMSMVVYYSYNPAKSGRK